MIFIYIYICSKCTPRGKSSERENEARFGWPDLIQVLRRLHKWLIVCRKLELFVRVFPETWPSCHESSSSRFDWLTGVFIDTQRFSAPESIQTTSSSGRAWSACTCAAADERKGVRENRKVIFVPVNTDPVESHIVIAFVCVLPHSWSGQRAW